MIYLIILQSILFLTLIWSEVNFRIKINKLKKQINK